MKDLIVLSGVPGSGKSTISELLRDKLHSSYIDFGWLREFHLDKDWKNVSDKEKKMSFENLVFILKNYIKNEYKNVIVSDLGDSQIQEIPKLFKDINFIIVSLIINNDDELRRRISKRDNGYRNIDESIKWNADLISRPTLINEFKIDNTINEPFETVEKILDLLQIKA